MREAVFFFRVMKCKNKQRPSFRGFFNSKKKKGWNNFGRLGLPDCKAQNHALVPISLYYLPDLLEILRGHEKTWLNN